MPVSWVILETDSTRVAAKLSRDKKDRSVHGPLVEEIKSLLWSFGDSSVRAVRRAANKAAHLLAKASLFGLLAAFHRKKQSKRNKRVGYVVGFVRVILVYESTRIVTVLCTI
jgi:hypothetical protein